MSLGPSNQAQTNGEGPPSNAVRAADADQLRQDRIAIAQLEMLFAQPSTYDLIQLAEQSHESTEQRHVQQAEMAIHQVEAALTRAPHERQRRRRVRR